MFIVHVNADPLPDPIIFPFESLSPSWGPWRPVRSCQGHRSRPPDPANSTRPTSDRRPSPVRCPANVWRPRARFPLFWTHETGFMAALASLSVLLRRAVSFQIFMILVSSQPRFCASLSTQPAAILLKARANVQLLDLLDSVFACQDSSRHLTTLFFFSSFRLFSLFPFQS